MKKITIALAMVMLFAAVGFAGDSAQVKEKKTDEAAKVDKAKPEKMEGDKATKEEAKEPEIITTESGLRYQDLVVGKGVEAIANMPVICHYTIWLADSTGLVKGKKIQSSKDSGKEFNFRVGQPNLIKGWNEGTLGMREGGVRRIFVPSKLGWGERGMGNMIPPNANVIFELEFLRQDTGKK